MQLYREKQKHENNELNFYSKMKTISVIMEIFCTISEVKEMALTIHEIFMQVFCEINFETLYDFQI